MDVNLKLKIPAIEQLLGYTASGIGAVAGPMLARWQARAKSDAIRIEAEGKADSIRLITSAQSEARDSLEVTPASVHAELDVQSEIRARISFQEEKRQGNIESVVRIAAEELGEKEVDRHEIDHDWTAQFFTNVQDVSSDMMQKIWARILSGEVESPGTISVKTLSILKLMSQRDAEVFENISQYSLGKIILRERKLSAKISDFPPFADFMRMEGHNLLHRGSGLHMDWRKRKEFRFPDRDIAIRIYRKDGSRLNLRIFTHALSDSGLELCRFVRNKLKLEFLEKIAEFLYEDHEISLDIAEIYEFDGKNSKIGKWINIDPSGETINQAIQSDADIVKRLTLPNTISHN
ncbi:MAG: DUF2806 domain-containing protein [Rhodospirillaceae bacterium]|nr:DUF2806 domain-containing protein [Rhodospirillaceae bacterium]